ncbi:GAF and ANTAR domain-containing protein [Saccharothrix australiensis]|uniref:GAF and ANTAR domain-containing protein n=1 Tax=Saccharothrix australiensis TaxID=2072 RepID=UPI000EB39B7C|nr:GAF and ANTAR domain-containing protein [Saccharothrix australiensis]
MDSRQPDRDRRAWLWDRISRLAEAEGVPSGVRHVSLTAAAVLSATDVVVYQVVDGGRCEPAHVTGPVGDWLSEAEITFGEGPAMDCLRQECPVVGDLAAFGGVRWPVFAPFALMRGVTGILAFPVVMGAVVVGCLEALRPTAEPPTPREVVDGLLLADAAMLVLLRAEPLPPGADPFSDAVEARWATVQRAVGVVSAQADSDLTTAFVRVRAHAYRTGRRLADVAADVLARRLRFPADPDEEPHTGHGPG